MRKVWYGVWAVIIVAGSMCGSAVPAEAKYITGFVFGCLAMGALSIARES